MDTIVVFVRVRRVDVDSSKLNHRRGADAS